jgi:hypothetical protein
VVNLQLGLTVAGQDRVRATGLLAEAVRLGVDSGDSPVLAMVLVGVAALAMHDADPAKAARMLGAAVAVRGSIDKTVPDVDRIEREARAALGDAGFEQAYRSGSDVTIKNAVAAADL